MTFVEANSDYAFNLETLRCPVGVWYMKRKQLQQASIMA